MQIKNFNLFGVCDGHGNRIAYFQVSTGTSLQVMQRIIFPQNHVHDTHTGYSTAPWPLDSDRTVAVADAAL